MATQQSLNVTLEELQQTVNSIQLSIAQMEQQVGIDMERVGQVQTISLTTTTSSTIMPMGEEIQYNGPGLVNLWSQYTERERQLMLGRQDNDRMNYQPLTLESLRETVAHYYAHNTEPDSTSLVDIMRPYQAVFNAQMIDAAIQDIRETAERQKMYDDIGGILIKKLEYI